MAPVRYKSAGRRELREELQATWKVRTIDPNNAARRVKVGSRQARRSAMKMADGKMSPRRVGIHFRPIIGHAIEVDPPHKAMIMAMRAIDRKRKMEWFKNQIAKAIVAWGEAMQ